MKLATKVKQKTAEIIFVGMAGMDRVSSGVNMNLFDAVLARNPYPNLNKLRDRQPVFYSRAFHGWWVTRFDLVQEILKDKRFGVDIRRFEVLAKCIRKNLSEDQRLEFEYPSMLSLDPPVHTRLRKLVSRGFLYKFIQSLAPRIQAIVDECLDRAGDQSRLDVVDCLAKPLPVIVIAEMMGLPEADYDQFQQWSEVIIEKTGTSDPKVHDAANKASRVLIDYFKRIIETKHGRPDDDLIGNGLILLLQQPEVFEKLRANPGGIPKAVEEMLRFEAPVQSTEQFARQDLDFYGHQFKRGDRIILSISAANRDPEVNIEPEEFDPFRQNIKQVAFGYGIHLCLGASLARLEAKITIESLMQRYPNMSLADERPAWGYNPFFRGLDELNINLNHHLNSGEV